MMNVRAPASVVLLAVALASGGCGPTESEAGILRITSEWAQPGPGVALSIGGYASFGRLTSSDGGREEFELGESYRADVPAGTYHLELWTVSQSDAIGVEIVPNGTPRIHRDFGPVDAACEFDVVVQSGKTVELRYRATVGSRDIVPAG